ncbi:MAG: nucleoid occlusion factor SlmA [Gammaproteobacteria bacterium]
MKTARQQQILEVLATELETRPGARISTASLAAALGVSEAALYRHFASKAKMFDALIDFAEETVFGLANRILEETSDAAARCGRICSVVLRFAEKNPGITRVLMGDILVGEHERLRARVAQFFDRLETQLRQILRDSLLSAGAQPDRALINAAASLILASVTGRLAQFVRSAYRHSPSAQWDEQWQMLAQGIFVARGVS